MAMAGQSLFPPPSTCVKWVPPALSCVRRPRMQVRYQGTKPPGSLPTHQCRACADPSETCAAALREPPRRTKRNRFETFGGKDTGMVSFVDIPGGTVTVTDARR